MVNGKPPIAEIEILHRTLIEQRSNVARGNGLRPTAPLVYDSNTPKS
jgi:hypothetical protein